jgi:ribosomal protein S19
MGRAVWKGSFVDKFALNKLNVKSSSNYFNIWTRRSVISSNFISKKIFVYTGNRFKPVFITREKIGFKFGELNWEGAAYSKWGIKSQRTYDVFICWLI